MRVLVVDDELDLIELYKLEFGFQLPQIECLTASNGQDALSLLKEQKIDLLITDGKMPVMNGVDLVRNLKELGLHLPCILVSGSIEKYDKAINEGLFTKVYTKPLNISDLITEISAYLPSQAS